MPLYEYRCRKCDTLFERLEKASEPTNCSCPMCGGEARRLIGAPALQFKGSGWYVNDYGSGKRAPSSDAIDSSLPTAESSNAGPTDAKIGASTDTKPKKKTDSKVA